MENWVDFDIPFDQMDREGLSGIILNVVCDICGEGERKCLYELADEGWGNHSVKSPPDFDNFDAELIVCPCCGDRYVDREQEIPAKLYNNIDWKNIRDRKELKLNSLKDEIILKESYNATFAKILVKAAMNEISCAVGEWECSVREPQYVLNYRIPESSKSIGEPFKPVHELRYSTELHKIYIECAEMGFRITFGTLEDMLSFMSEYGIRAEIKDKQMAQELKVILHKCDRYSKLRKDINFVIKGVDDEI